MGEFKLLVLAILMMAIVTVTLGKRAKKPTDEMAMFKNIGRSACESRDEHNKCKDSCYDDHDCNDVTNLNCGQKCNTACAKIDKLGKCKSAMIYQILDLRGRLSKSSGRHGGKRGKKHR